MTHVAKRPRDKVFTANELRISNVTSRRHAETAQPESELILIGVDQFPSSTGNLQLVHVLNRRAVLLEVNVRSHAQIGEGGSGDLLPEAGLVGFPAEPADLSTDTGLSPNFAEERYR